MSVFTNRTLNMKKIKAIGFDMDHTLIKYFTKNFEAYTYNAIKEKLIKSKNYPELIRTLTFDFDRVIQGLVIDKHRGNLLKLSRFGKVKSSYHGTSKIDFQEQNRIYAGKEIDLNAPHIKSLDTSFSLSHGILFSQLVDLKDKLGSKFSSYETIADDLREVLDAAHQDGTLKDEVRKNIKQYIQTDPQLPKLLELYKENGKKLIIITNSDYAYTKLLMDYVFNPHLEKHKSWMDLFEITITNSCKPRFFLEKQDFLKVDPSTGLMSNTSGPVEPGIYQGGSAAKLQKDLKMLPNEILYLGDHIYGDVLSIKKTFSWRTALVIEPLFEELASIKKAKEVQLEIDNKMEIKRIREHKLNELFSNKNKGKVNELYRQIEEINNSISTDIELYQSYFNPYWGELLRSGHEESRLAGHVEKYACIYMASVNDLLMHSPRTYFRPIKRIMPHEYI
ncbi:MAG: HAD-IG family 5'-nucleotidase [Bacteriovoracaceae bacterium]|nr:HAD-IG family 5'-nucleotidase [Bacteriovoracaceae bacterium]